MKANLSTAALFGALLTAGTAHGADLTPDVATPAPQADAAPLPSLSWTGCYVGGEVGLGAAKDTLYEKSEYFGTIGSPITGSERRSKSGYGATFGGRIGCDYEFANHLLFGVGGDFLGTSGFGGRAGEPLDSTESIGLGLNWIASATARIGYTGFNPSLLPYLKGGVAWSDRSFNLRDTTINLGGGTVHDIATGWTAGAGIEYRFTPHWSATLEYDHYGFGKSDIAAYSESGLYAQSNSLKSSSSADLVMVGLNFRLPGF